MHALLRPFLAIAILFGSISGALAQAFPLTIEHALGTVTIPAEPQRVVALMDRDVDTLLALGIKPVALRSWYNFEEGAGPWSIGLFGEDRPVVWQGRDLNFEAIASVEPDLIVFASSGGDVPEYEQLSEIAPTISLPRGELPWGSTTTGTTLLIAEAVGRKAEGERLVAGLEEYLAGIRADHPEFTGRTANYLDVHSGGLTYYAATQFINRTLYDLGFAPVEAVRDMPADTSYVTVSGEQASLTDADILLVYPFGQTRAEILDANPILGRLSAFRNGGAIILPDLAFSQASVLSIPYALDSLVPEMSAALSE